MCMCINGKKIHISSYIDIFNVTTTHLEVLYDLFFFKNLTDSGSLSEALGVASTTSQTPDKEPQKFSGLADDSLPTLAISDARAG